MMGWTALDYLRDYAIDVATGGGFALSDIPFPGAFAFGFTHAGRWLLELPAIEESDAMAGLLCGIDELETLRGLPTGVTQ